MAWEKDVLNRKPVADFLTRLLDNNEDVSVVNINSPWGTGKTFFIENWYEQLIEERAVVKINAWDSDFVKDPFLFVASEINIQARGYGFKSEDDSISEKLKKFVSNASGAFVATTHLLAKGFIRSISKRYFDTDANEISEAAFDGASEMSQKLVEKYIQDGAQEKETIARFIESFRDLVESLSKINVDGEKPVYIFIDELDRCRPTFAVEVLERVKHLMVVPNCKFVFSTDTGQLIHSISKIYGSNFDSKKYLNRFFDTSYTLDNSDIKKFVAANLKIKKGLYVLNIVANRPDFGSFYSARQFGEAAKVNSKSIFIDDSDLESYQLVFYGVVKAFGLSLRETIKAARNVRLAVAYFEEKDVDIFWVSYLVVAHIAAPEELGIAMDSNHSLAIKNIKEKFESVLFYTGRGNEDVHDLAALYFEAASLSPSDRRDWFERRIESNSVFKQPALNMANGWEHRKYYDAVVFMKGLD